MGQRGRVRAPAIALLCVTGCGDEVVGYFGGDTTGSDGVATFTAVDETTATSAATTGEMRTPFIPPGCYTDGFDGSEIDDLLWSTWADPDATLGVAGGMLKFEPPSTGLADTGVVGSFDHVFPFTAGRVQMRVPLPPDPSRPVLLFLRVIDESGDLVSIRITEGLIRIDAAVADAEIYAEQFPMQPYPAWLAIRADGDQIHYEIGDDGTNFTTLTTRAAPGPMPSARGLIMAQTYADDLAGGVVAVDDFQVCVD